MLNLIERCQHTQCIAVCCIWGCIAAGQSGCLDPCPLLKAPTVDMRAMEEGEEQISLTSQLTGLKGSAATILVPETTAQGSSGVHVSTGQQKGDTDVFHGLLEFILSLDHLVFGPVSDSSFLDLHCNIIWY